jgi:phosphoribosyl 1,2-cyclic phosphate phosphodiesterase
MGMKITILGSGTSTGVPQIGCTCPTCVSTDPRDKRLRCSSLLEIDGKRILFDCSPDFREQMMRLPYAPIDALLITHEHYDHVGGLDDLRPFCQFGDVDVYVEDYCAQRLRQRMPYCFTPKENRYPGVPGLNLIDINPNVPFVIGGSVEVLPFRVMHGALPILGFRIRNFVYITDMKTIPEEVLPVISDADVLVVNALRRQVHNSHQTIDDAIDFSKRINAHETYFIHMSHHVSPYEEEVKNIPRHFHLTYDGMVINVPDENDK